MKINGLWTTVEGTGPERGGMRELVRDQIGDDVLYTEMVDEMTATQTVKILVAVMVAAAVERDHEYFGEDFRIHCALLKLNPYYVKRLFKEAWKCEDAGFWEQPEN